jgi:hypothetical protein
MFTYYSTLVKNAVGDKGQVVVDKNVAKARLDYCRSLQSSLDGQMRKVETLEN